MALKAAVPKTIVNKIIETFPLFMHTLMRGYSSGPDDLGLNKTQMKTLYIIHYHKNAHMGEICRHMNMEKGSFTPVVDALLEKGLIQRERDNNDRRKINLILTETGMDMVIGFEKRMNNHIQTKIEKLSDTDQSRFVRAVDDLNEIVAKL